MANPRSLVYALYTHWDTVEVLVRLSREFAVLTSDQVLGCIAKVSPQLDAEAQGGALRAMVNADILQPCARSSDLQLNAYVLDFVRGLTREHELGLAAVLQARVTAIREATEALNEGMQGIDMDRARGAANKLAELFRQISLQLDQDRHALLELAEDAKSADASMPIAQRYRRVLEAYDHYVEPMNQMMDTGPQGTFYRYLEDAERSLDLAFEQLSVQGGLYSHRLQLRQVAHQTKELRRFGRLIAQQCADTVLPLREEMRQHNALTSAVSLLLGQVRKRGLRRALSRHAAGTTLPVWRNERGFRLQLGDEVRAVMAAAQQYQPQSVAFPQDEPGNAPQLLEHVDEAAIRQQLRSSLPVDSLLDWLHTHHGHLQDATLLRLFHELQHESNWQIEASEHPETTTLQAIRVLHHPHRVSHPE
ncbi:MULTISPECIES: hypothetical protein [Burkholderiales]|jgi:hypothetical protein|uniref:Amino acid adenylation domain-containing protein n=2 Tax=Burkholderiales TaxID=80840 RepID=A0A848P9S0_9RALS|nr:MULTISPECIES: hypothetical protein [Burkholderiales]EPD43703.1 hypothetical protein HMPREF9701_00728 [Delftia acidovorans CCUG 274B]MDR3064351.1 hypothetical protein [Comamonas sp.]NMV40298.1 amino acid adenylation domain-containing protein [Ralstonia insidiosa]SDY12229.1 hypothetical protein SAMN05421547_102552 [Delftia lacustris]